jgi:hypothetical protein
MSFRTKNKMKARARVMKSQAVVKNLTRFQKGHDIPRQPTNQGKAKWHLDPK